MLQNVLVNGCSSLSDGLRAPSTRHAYALKWNLLVEWCSFHREDPRKCPIRVMLSFLQQVLDLSLSEIPIRRSSDVTSPFPSSGNEGYIRNRDVTLVFKKHNGPTPADEIAPQIITDCGNITLDFKQLGI